MNRFQIKVCGITRLVDADRVAALGGDMIGFIFYPRSPRFVKLAEARIISRAASPHLDRVGVFVNAGDEKILRTADQVRLNIIQLHSGGTARQIARLQREGYKVTQVFGVANRFDLNELARCRADFVMLDRMSADRPGGSGRTFDWSLCSGKRPPNLILAGGITTDNVAEGVRRFRPLVVDVNSGVESQPGIKSANKMKSFFEKCSRLRYGRR